VLNDHEQRVWDDVQRFWAETAEEPAADRRAAAFMRARARREQGDAPPWVVGGAWIAIFLVLFGAVVAGLALGAAAMAGWALWRYWPELTERGARSVTLPVTGEMLPAQRLDERP
jgi:hypothetical protein